MTASRDAYDAILLVSFGGPEGPDEVMPFLENVVRGRGVPKERLVAVAEHYLQFGGISPINQQNRQLIVALQNELTSRNIHLPIYWGNRHWRPFLHDVVSELKNKGHQSILAVLTSAYSSYSGCRQYREELANAVVDNDCQSLMKIDKIRPYFDSPGFVLPFVDGITDAVNQLKAEDPSLSTPKILFTTHSIPKSMSSSSGPPELPGLDDGAYVTQHRSVAEIVIELVAERGTVIPSWELVYQSRSGPAHIPWLEPDINDAIRRVQKEGFTSVVIVPIGFVSDHMEVVWDLDNEASATCTELGVRVRRVATPGTDPRFVRSLADLVVEKMGGSPAPALSDIGPWPAPCLPGCCPNPREQRLHVAGRDSTL
jgi:ferrochelatase